MTAIRKVGSAADRATLGARVEEAAARLAGEAGVPDDVRQEVRRIAEDVLVLTEVDSLDADPYLAVALQQGAIASLLSLTDRRGLRIALEQMRQALRDIQEGLPVRDDRPAREVAAWLAETLDLPQAEVARLVGTSHRTFQRWLSGEAEPRGEEARRLRVVARMAANLRHALTGPGVMAWFARRHPALGGRPPAALLDDPAAIGGLARLAAAARSAGAA